MTTEAYPGPEEYTVNGTGPYAINHEYTQNAIAPFVVIEGVETALDSDDYSLSAESGDSGNLTLSAGAATTHDGRTLRIYRETPIEQGWSGGNSRERGVEVQMDRTVQSVQEALYWTRRSLRTTTAHRPLDLTNVDDITLIWKDNRFQPGPTANEVSGAQEYALAAKGYRDDAQEIANGLVGIALEADGHFETYEQAVEAWSQIIDVGGTVAEGMVWQYRDVFIKYDGQTDVLPGLTGWRPMGDLALRHFNAPLNGTDSDSAALQAALNYAGENNIIGIYALEGDDVLLTETSFVRHDMKMLDLRKAMRCRASRHDIPMISCSDPADGSVAADNFWLRGGDFLQTSTLANMTETTFYAGSDVSDQKCAGLVHHGKLADKTIMITDTKRIQNFIHALSVFADWENADAAGGTVIFERNRECRGNNFGVWEHGIDTGICRFNNFYGTVGVIEGGGSVLPPHPWYGSNFRNLSGDYVFEGNYDEGYSYGSTFKLKRPNSVHFADNVGNGVPALIDCLIPAKVTGGKNVLYNGTDDESLTSSAGIWIRGCQPGGHGINLVGNVIDAVAPDVNAVAAQGFFGPRTIDTITLGATTTISFTSIHDFITGDTVIIDDAGGVTELEGNVYTITVVDWETITLDGVDSTAYTAHSSGGTVDFNRPDYVAHGFIEVSGTSYNNDFFVSIDDDNKGFYVKVPLLHIAETSGGNIFTCQRNDTNFNPNGTVFEIERITMDAPDTVVMLYAEPGSTNVVCRYNARMSDATGYTFAGSGQYTIDEVNTFEDGSGSNPSMAFRNEPTLGWYRKSAGVMALPTGKELQAGSFGGTGVQANPLDTTDGRVLKHTAFGLGRKAGNFYNQGDGNAELATGFFGGDGTGAVNFPAPGTRFGPFLSLNRGVSSTEFTQLRLFFDVGTGEKTLWMQDSAQGAVGDTFTWYDPVMMYSQQTVLGTVSLSSGVPAGALIEYDSNSDGEYIKFADGTMIQWGIETGAGTSVTPDGNIYRSAAITFNYPVAFATGTIPSLSVSVNSTETVWAQARSLDRAAGSARIMSAVSTATNFNLGWQAVGRWA